MEVTGILETCLYAENLSEAEAFYSKFPGIDLVSKEKDRHVFFRCGSSMLLIFNPKHTANEQTDVDGQAIPLHGASGAGHVAFSIQTGFLNKWKELLQREGIEIESEVTWPNGHISIYFRDPAGNSLELVSSEIWGIKN